MKLEREYQVHLEDGRIITVTAADGPTACRAHNETAADGEKADWFYLLGTPFSVRVHAT